jgi:hypothetical protein
MIELRRPMVGGGGRWEIEGAMTEGAMTEGDEGGHDGYRGSYLLEGL